MDGVKAYTPRDKTLYMNNESHSEEAKWNFLELSFGRGICCSGSGPLTNTGKWLQLIRMILLVASPVLVLLGLTGYFLWESVIKRDQLSEQKEVIFYGRELGGLIHVLQKERDQTALYLSAIGPDTKIYLLDRYTESNLALSKLSAWPVNFDRYQKHHFGNKELFGNFISAHRNALDLMNPTVYEEIQFYNGEIEILIKWLYEAISLSRFGGIWKSLVTYKKIVTCKEAAGVERALGSTYFANGGFESNSFYLWYLRQVNTFVYEYSTAQLFSKDVPKMSKIITPTDESHLFVSVLSYREQLFDNKLYNSSVVQAKYYYDNMTLFIDKLFNVQKKLGDDISDTLALKEKESMKNIIIAIMVLTIAVVIFPIQMWSLRSQTNDIQSYSVALFKKTGELTEEKRRTKVLIHKMIPDSIATKLINRERVNEEYFSSATILFTHIDQFNRIVKEYPVTKVINLLEEMHLLIEMHSEHFDVYKFSNIGDQTMVVSGLPNRNMNKHGREITDFALEVLDFFKAMDSLVIDEKVPIRLGIHSGPVIGVVVGIKIPKYCLFGNTVKVASKMERTGMGNKIHISETTRSLLKKTRKYKFTCRGTIDTEGQGEMLTYWIDTDDYSVSSKVRREVEIINVKPTTSNNLSLPIYKKSVHSPSRTQDLQNKTMHKADQFEVKDWSEHVAGSQVNNKQDNKDVDLKECIEMEELTYKNFVAASPQRKINNDWEEDIFMAS